MQAVKPSRNEYLGNVAAVERKIKLVEEAKRKLQQHVQSLHAQYAKGLISYESFDAKVKAFLKGRTVDAWLQYYDATIKVYKQHGVHYEKQAVRAEERTVNIKYFGIFLVLALTLGIFLFVPYFHFESVFPTGGVSAGVTLNQTVYITNATLDSNIKGGANVTIIFYNNTGSAPDFVPYNTTLNVSIVGFNNVIVNSSTLNYSEFVLNSTTPWCLNFSLTGIYADQNGSWPLIGRKFAGYGYNATIGVAGASCTFPNRWTTNLSRFFPPFATGPATVGFYNVSVNVSTMGTFQPIANFTLSFIVDNIAPNWTNVRMNDSRPFVPNNISLQFNVSWGDDLNLDGFVFGLNTTATNVTNLLFFKNSSYNFFGQGLYNKTFNISINISQVFVPKGGTNVTWFFFANDSSGKMNITGIQSFIVNTPSSITSVSILPPFPLRSGNINLSASVSGITDLDTDSVNLTYTWFRNNVPITVLNMPMTNKIYSYGTNTTFDFSGLNNYGTIWTSTVRFNRTGKIGGAYTFGANRDDNITILNSVSLNITNKTGNLTLEAWVLVDGFANNNSIIAKNGTLGYTLRLFNGVPQLTIGLDNSSIASVPIVKSGSWYDIVGVWNGTSCMVFINGTKYGGSSSCRSLPDTSQNLLIGNDVDKNVGGIFNGTIDEVKVYNISLNPEQIGANYYGGIGLYNTTLPNITYYNDTWNVSVTPIDDDGLNGTTVYSSKVLLEMAPVVTLLTPINATNSSLATVNFTFSVVDSDANLANATLYASWPNGQFIANQTNLSTLNNGLSFTNFINVTQIPEGNWTWNIYACDFNSHCSFNTTVNFTISVDRTAPNVTNIQPVNNTRNSTSTFIDFYYNVTNNVTVMANCTLLINNTQSITIGAGTSIAMGNVRNNISGQLGSNGKYNYTVSCTDAAGNNGNSTYSYFNTTVSAVSCIVSTEALNISFGNSVGQNSILNASHNFDGFTLQGGNPGVNWSWYNITNDATSTDPINVTIKGSDLIISGASPPRTIGVGNVSWNSTTVTGNDTSLVYPGKANISTAVDNINAIASSLSVGSTAWWRFWLNVPAATLAGNYVGNYTVTCTGVVT